MLNSPIAQIVQVVLTVVLGVLLFISAIRAMKFANRHRDRLQTVMEKSAWWMLLLKRGGYGEECEAERKRLAFWCIGSLVAFFAYGGLMQLQAHLILSKTA